MKKLFQFMLILLVALAAGCLTSDEGDDNGDETGGTYSITGKVVDDSGSGISGVSVKLTGETAEKTAGENVNLTVSTNSEGIFTFQNIKNGTYVISPSKSEYSFVPSSRTVQVNGSDVTVPNFSGSEKGEHVDEGGDDGGGKYTVSGRIVDSAGSGISSVTVALAGISNSFTAVTDAGGNYSFNEVPDGSYGLVPEKSDYTFSPEFKTVIVGGANVTLDAFVGSTESGGDGGDGSSDAGSHSFYPLKKGATWTYHVKDTDVESNDTDEYDYTVSISGTEVVDGKEYWVMVDEDNEFDGYFRIEDGILYVYGGNDVYAKIPKMFAKAVGAGKAAEDINPFDSEIPMVDLNAGIGQTFVIMDHTESDSGMTMTMKMTGKYVGNKNVDLSFEKFYNCRQYELVTEYSISSDLFSSSSISTSETYLAPNVGLIKSTDKDYEDDKLGWIYDEELTSYYIP